MSIMVDMDVFQKPDEAGAASDMNNNKYNSEWVKKRVEEFRVGQEERKKVRDRLRFARLESAKQKMRGVMSRSRFTRCFTSCGCKVGCGLCIVVVIIILIGIGVLAWKNKALLAAI